MTTGGRERRKQYVSRLTEEIAHYEGSSWSFDSIYFGGGTPSSLEPEDLERILAAIRSTFSLSEDVRISLEANPEDASPSSLGAWRALGVSTLSLGVQSLNPGSLAFLGRCHSPADASRSVQGAREAGFDTVSVDLIYGLPGQVLSEWRRDLDAAVALAPDHVSCYQLTIHEGTPFGARKAKGEMLEISEDAQGELFRFTHEFLNGHGLQGYEVSNFARSPEHRSRHNQKYWRHVPYLGIGPGAHSFDGRRRWWNHRRLADWAERPVDGEETLENDALAFESLLLGLRTYDGVNLGAIEAQYGVELAGPNRALLDELARQGLVRIEGLRIVPTVEGLAVADGLATALRMAATA